MSDNPTDGLRRELETALDLGRLLNERTVNNIVDDLESVVTAALEAARADERERARRQAFTEAADTIRSLMDRQPLFDERDTWAHDVYGEALRAVRGLGEETENA